ncbi:hypothetical protein D1007_18633 [Hordeum vulgare]|nr:hypothetical protein D1007_18633 [Hordeum vulgare]
MDFVRGLGADEVLNYRTPKGAALRGPSGRRYNAVANCAVVGWGVVGAQGSAGRCHTWGRRRAHIDPIESDHRQEEACAADAARRGDH